MLDHISVSQIETYLGCPLKYQFQYVEGRPFPFRPSGLAFGSAVHTALEWYHQKEKQGRQVTVEQVWRIFDADWQGQKFDNIRFKSRENENGLIDLGHRIIAVYLKAPFPAATEAVEATFSVPIIDPINKEILEIPLVGRFDRIEQGPVIVDIKKTKQKYNQTDADSSLQLTAYAYAYWKLYDIEPQLRLDVLTKTENPKLERIATRRSQRHYRILFLQAKNVLDGIRHEVFYANPSWRCTDCEFRNCCWYWNGKYESLPQAA